MHENELVYSCTYRLMGPYICVIYLKTYVVLIHVDMSMNNI